jgi:hypothetical protein
MLAGFNVIPVSAMEDIHEYLRSYSNHNPDLDFVILDDQSETRVDDLARSLHSLRTRPFKNTKIIHLYTPTTSSSGHPIFANSTIPGVAKMTKPPRLARLLQTLADLNNLPHPMVSHQPSEVRKAIEDLANAQRTLYGNVLIAEGKACGPSPMMH